MILLPGKWLFVSTMKCATNTLYKDLKTVSGAHWVGGSHFHGYPAKREAPLHWTVVRNPYARAVSIWASTCLRKASHEKYDAYSYIKAQGGDPLQFTDFVDYVLLKQPPLRVPALYTNQTSWVKQFTCDLFLHLETLQDDLKEKLGLDLELSLENTSPHEEWTKYYTPELYKRLNSWAGPDCLNFDYPITGHALDTTEYHGRALPGAEERAETMDTALLSSMLQTDIYPGTVNVALVEDIPLGPPAVNFEGYRLWPCQIDGDEWTTPCGWVDAWIIKFAGEDLPDNYIELISGICVREHLNMQDFPSYIVKLKI